MDGKKRICISVFLVAMFFFLFPKQYVYADLLEKSNTESYEFQAGDGTEENPYQISNVYQLQRINDYLGCSFVLINDIDAGTIDGWIPIGTYDDPFIGKMNGNGFAIRNICFNDRSFGEKSSSIENDVIGLFGYIGNDVSIKNLVMIDVKANFSCVRDSIFFGCLVGENKSNNDYYEICNCVVYGDGFFALRETNYCCCIGGLVGKCGDGRYSMIANCQNYFNIDAKLPGYATAECGGIVGCGNLVKIDNCSNFGNIIVEGPIGITLGGIIGCTTNDIANCVNIGELSGYAYGSWCSVGGMTGQNTGGEIRKCRNYANINSKGIDSYNAGYNIRAGGICGHLSDRFVYDNDAFINSCMNYGNKVSSFYLNDKNEIKEAYAGRIYAYYEKYNYDIEDRFKNNYSQNECLTNNHLTDSEKGLSERNGQDFEIGSEPWKWDAEKGIGFDLTENGYCVVNKFSSFDYDIQTNILGEFGYTIPLERYQEVFGPSYTKHIYDQNIKIWNGNCFGMSVTAAMFYKEMLQVGDYVKGGVSLNDGGYDDMVLSEGKAFLKLKKDSELTKLIERYQIWQDSNEFYKEAEEDILNYPNEFEDMFSQVISNIKMTREPYIVMVWWNGDDKKVKGHALVVDSARIPKELGDGWVRIFLYDPNNPFFDDFDNKLPSECYTQAENRYVDVNVKNGQWKMDAMVNGSGKGTTAIGYDKNGNLLRESTIIFISTNGFPANFTNKATFSADKESTKIAFSSDNIEVCDSKEKSLFKIVNGEIVYINNDIVKMYCPCEYAEGIELGSHKGSLILPKGEYTVSIENGAVAYMEEGDYAGVVTKDSISVSNNESTALSIKSSSFALVNVVLADISSENNFSSIESNIQTGEKGLDISLVDTNLNIDTDYKQNIEISTVTEDGEKDIFEEVSDSSHFDISSVINSEETNCTAKTIKLSKTKYTYNGKIKEPTVTVYNNNGDVIASSNYTVNYPKGRKNVGEYVVEIGFKGDYSGAEKIAFFIIPSKTKIEKLTAKNKAFVVKWTKKTKQITGYEIQYSTSSSFKKGNKSIKVNSSKTTTKTIKNLKKNKKYYVRVRTYKIVNGKIFYSKWSAKKTIKTK